MLKLHMLLSSLGYLLLHWLMSIDFALHHLSSILLPYLPIASLTLWFRKQEVSLRFLLEIILQDSPQQLPAESENYLCHKWFYILSQKWLTEVNVTPNLVLSGNFPFVLLFSVEVQMNSRFQSCTCGAVQVKVTGCTTLTQHRHFSIEAQAKKLRDDI